MISDPNSFSEINKNFKNQLNTLKRIRPKSNKNIFGLKLRNILVGSLLLSVILGGGYFLFRFLNRSLDQASASQIDSSLLDSGFGENGVAVLPTISGSPAQIITTKETGKGFLVSLLQAKSGSSTGIYKTLENGSADSSFGENGLVAFDFPDLKAVDLDMNSEFIYTLGSIDSCKIETNNSNCGGVDLLLSKKSLETGIVDNAFGENGYLRINLSENLNLSKIPQRAENPVKIKVLASGEIVVASDYYYQSGGDFKVGIVIAKYNSDGESVKNFGTGGVFYINPVIFPGLLRSGSSLVGRDLKIQNRNNISIEFQTSPTDYAEINLDVDGKIIKNSINNENVYILRPDFESKDFLPKQILSQRGKTGGVIFYGTCQSKNNFQEVFCLLVYNSGGKLDSSFASENKNVFVASFPQSSDIQFDPILEDFESGQMLINLSFSRQDGNEISNETLLIKQNGKLNTNFANLGKWRRSGRLQTKLIDSKGRFLVGENQNIYRLQKPLFIDPVITQIQPESGNVEGGLEVTLTGDNFIKNPENPKFSSIQKVLLGSNQDSIIDNLDQVFDKEGNLILTGSFRSSLKIDTQTAISEKGFADSFVAKVSKENKVIWLNVIGGQGGDDLPKKLFLDSNGDILILLQGSSELNYFDNPTPKNQAKNNLSLLKYKPDGVLSWVTNFSSSNQIQSLNEIHENDQSYVLAGDYKSDITSSSSTLNNNLQTPFVANINKTTGNTNWLKDIPSDNFSKISKVYLSDQDILIWGEFLGKILDQPSVGGKDLFYTKIDQQGSFLETKILGGSGEDSIEDLVLNTPKKTFYISGFVDTESSFITAFDLDGRPIWRIPGGGKVVLDNDESLILTGNFQKEFQIDNQTLKNQEGSSVFVAKVSSAGKLLWLKEFLGNSQNSLTQIKVTKSNEIYITAGFAGTSTIEQKVLTAVGQDSYLAKISPAGSLLWLKQSGGKGVNKLTFVQSDSNSEISVILKSTQNSSFDNQKIENEDFAQATVINLEEKDIQVFLGEIAVTSFTVINPNKMIIITPKSQQGKKDLKVVGYDGSETIFSNAFEYVTGVEIKNEDGGSKPSNPTKSPIII
jgi:hypothetical protein